jgi:hypothetical protein
VDGFFGVCFGLSGGVRTGDGFGLAGGVHPSMGVASAGCIHGGIGFGGRLRWLVFVVIGALP